MKYNLQTLGGAKVLAEPLCTCLVHCGPWIQQLLQLTFHVDHFHFFHLAFISQLHLFKFPLHFLLADFIIVNFDCSFDLTTVCTALNCTQAKHLRIMSHLCNTYFHLLFFQHCECSIDIQIVCVTYTHCVCLHKDYILTCSLATVHFWSILIFIPLFYTMLRSYPLNEQAEIQYLICNGHACHFFIKLFTSFCL